MSSLNIQNRAPLNEMELEQHGQELEQEHAQAFGHLRLMFVNLTNRPPLYFRSSSATDAHQTISQLLKNVQRHSL
jgi:hypothetical protein